MFSFLLLTQNKYNASRMTNLLPKMTASDYLLSAERFRFLVFFLIFGKLQGERH